MNHDTRVKRCQVRPIPPPPYITEAPPEPDLTSGTVTTLIIAGVLSLAFMGFSGMGS